MARPAGLAATATRLVPTRTTVRHSSTLHLTVGGADQTVRL
ncbi:MULTISPECIES: hypothetical protein [unclassified Actinoplanes]|nr:MULTISPECIES: hypothetical protein [unclassified Actinoplanes]